MVCAACSADVPDDDLFCENCGEKLRPNEVAAGGCVCGAAADAVDEDGFCEQCGRRLRRPPSDHIELALSPQCAAVSDRGLRHERNEDRFALVQAGSNFGLVVCDGVSSTSNADVASVLATEEIAHVFQQALCAETSPKPESVVAQAAANVIGNLRARSGVARDDASPSTTMVAALLVGATLTVGWLGDSRAYWVDADGAELLTRDHSWLNLVLEQGTMSPAEAQLSPQAHAITRWLGADADENSPPELVQRTFRSEGTLLLCTDGLWNYATAAEQIAALVQDTRELDALSAAQAMVAYAIAQGGRDNITVALLRIAATPPQPVPPDAV